MTTLRGVAVGAGYFNQFDIIEPISRFEMKLAEVTGSDCDSLKLAHFSASTAAGAVESIGAFASSLGSRNLV